MKYGDAAVEFPNIFDVLTKDEKENNDNSNNNTLLLLLLQSIIERIKDVDVKVRESALDYLRERINFATQLTEDQRVEILRTGLTRR